MEAAGQLPRILSLVLSFHSLGEWRHLVCYQVAQSRRTGGHSDVIVGLVLTRSDVSASLSIIVVGCVPTWVRVIHHCGRMCSHLDGCDNYAFLTSNSNISAKEDLHGG